MYIIRKYANLLLITRTRQLNDRFQCRVDVRHVIKIYTRHTHGGGRIIIYFVVSCDSNYVIVVQR